MKLALNEDSVSRFLIFDFTFSLRKNAPAQRRWSISERCNIPSTFIKIARHLGRCGLTAHCSIHSYTEWCMPMWVRCLFNRMYRFPARKCGRTLANEFFFVQCHSANLCNERLSSIPTAKILLSLSSHKYFAKNIAKSFVNDGNNGM